MRQLFPEARAGVELDEAYRAARPPRADRPWVLVNMITTIDGAIDLGGVSGPLGGESDKAVFATLRAVADVVLVGSATAVAERYRPPSTSVSIRARRLANGAAPVARVAIVSASLGFGLDLPVLAAPTPRTIVVTTDDAPAARIDALTDRVDLVRAGSGRVDLAVALGELAAGGARAVLCEGGPTLNAQLLAQDLVDELCVTISPLAVAGRSRRLAEGDGPAAPVAFDLAHVLTDDHFLFLRYLRAHGETTSS
jgi:riboflavin biosynthesis pyrimidine reductase